MTENLAPAGPLCRGCSRPLNSLFTADSSVNVSDGGLAILRGQRKPLPPRCCRSCCSLRRWLLPTATTTAITGTAIITVGIPAITATIIGITVVTATTITGTTALGAKIAICIARQRRLG
jgi:hypothetical protein